MTISTSPKTSARHACQRHREVILPRTTWTFHVAPDAGHARRTGPPSEIFCRLCHFPTPRACIAIIACTNFDLRIFLDVLSRVLTVWMCVMNRRYRRVSAHIYVRNKFTFATDPFSFPTLIPRFEWKRYEKKHPELFQRRKNECSVCLGVCSPSTNSTSINLTTISQNTEESRPQNEENTFYAWLRFKRAFYITKCLEHIRIHVNDPPTK